MNWRFIGKRGCYFFCYNVLKLVDIENERYIYLDTYKNNKKVYVYFYIYILIGSNMTQVEVDPKIAP